MDKNTKIIAICDGAKNCWGAISTQDKFFHKIIKILAWFHIGENLKNVQQKLFEEYCDELEKVKWSFWHGNAKKYYRAFIINKSQKYHSKLPYTSSIVESAIADVINERQKKQKMQWTSLGTHCILQMRTLIISK